MNLTLPLTAAEEARLISKAQAKGITPEALILQALEPVIGDRSDLLRETQGSRRHIAEVIAERMKSVPVDAFDELPTDGASEHDHYIYGLPKRNQ